jgi:dTDP-4-dehydrorhamnose reductase
MSNVLILGSNGQLGSDLVKICKQENIKYMPITRDEFDALHDDISEKLLIHKPDYIINCIATTNVDGCEGASMLAFNTNTDFVYNLAKFCNANNITLTHISTDYVFDGNKTTPYLETDIPNPKNIYGLSKYAGEIAVQIYMTKYFIFRVSSLFGQAGASGKGGNFITTMKSLGQDKNPVKVIADQITCPTATLDIAKCIAHFIKNQIKDYGIYNCVSSNSCSWFEFARVIFESTGLDKNKVLPVDFASYKFIASRPKYSAMSTAKLSKYYQMPTWQQGLAEYFK